MVWFHWQYNKINAAAILQALARLLQRTLILFVAQSKINAAIK